MSPRAGSSSCSTRSASWLQVIAAAGCHTALAALAALQLKWHPDRAVHAGHGGIRSILDDMKLLSTEAEGVHEAVPAALREKLVNEQGRVGALLGLKASSGSSGDCRAACCSTHSILC